MAANWQLLQNVYDDVRFRTGTGTTSTSTGIVSDASLLRIANKWFFKIFGALVEGNEDLYVEVSDFNLVSGQREYSLPIDKTTTKFGDGSFAWAILRLEVKLDGTNWRVAEGMQWSSIERATATDTDISGQFTTSAPKFTALDNSVWILPVPTANVTSGARIFYVKRPDELTSVADVLSSTTYMLNKEFMDILGYGMSADIYERQSKTKQMSDAIALYEAGIERMKRQAAGRTGPRSLQMLPRKQIWT